MVTDSKKVENYFKDNFLIECSFAIIGGRRLDKDDPLQHINLKCFLISWEIKKLLRSYHFSRAEFDRLSSIDHKSNNLDDSFPLDYYGMSKNIISRIIKGHPYTNLRLYGLFGPDEDDDRFIKMCINRSKSAQKLVINNDKFFDFFYVKDLIEILKQIISGKFKLNKWLDLV